MRPGGRGPIFAWHYGLQILPLLAFVLVIVGTIKALREKPFLRPGRKLPFLLLLLLVGAGGIELPYPSSHEGHESTICFRLPFATPREGEWTVFWGGETREASLLAAYTASRRFGLDLVVAKEGATSSPDGRSLVVGEDVLAPCDGEVVRAGRTVVIRVSDGEYLFLGNVDPVATAGQRLERGERIGSVAGDGASRFTPEPHLEIHLQDTPEDGTGEPIPWRFCDYVADGRVVERGLPHGGIGPRRQLRGQRIAPRGS
jgi:Peptidase family M23